MPLTAGSRIGPYEIQAPLGAGGMGEVYRARDSKLGRDVALKNRRPPQWSPDGREIFYYTTDGSFVRSVTTVPSFVVSNEAALPFNVYAGRGPGGGRDADIMPDGNRWVAVSAADRSAGAAAFRQFNVVLNWHEELKRLVPTR